MTTNSTSLLLNVEFDFYLNNKMKPVPRKLPIPISLTSIFLQMVKLSSLSVPRAANQYIRMISEEPCATKNVVMMLKIQLCHHRHELTDFKIEITNQMQ